MTRLLATAILSITLLLPAMLLAAQAQFDASQGLVEVEVRIDGRATGKFGLDTGADRLYIDKSFAEKNYLARDGIPDQRKVIGIAGATGGYFVTFRSFEIGDQHLHNVKATVIDFDELSGQQNGNHPDGLIGYDVLSRMYVTVDYPHQTIDLELNRPRFLSGRQFETIRFNTYQHLILVDVTFPGGQIRPMILDYCASFTSISPELATDLGFDSDPNQIQLLDLNVGDVIFSDGVETVVQDYRAYSQSLPRAKFDGILGRTFLNQHKITINYKQSEIYLHDQTVAGN